LWIGCHNSTIMIGVFLNFGEKDDYSQTTFKAKKLCVSTRTKSRSHYYFWGHIYTL
jgi:hypothetical protein